jgi:hypothetical protein
MSGQINRTTPIGLYNFGVSYLDTARAALASTVQIRFQNPVEFLCAHGLELIFKADLTRHQTLDVVRQRYGHCLTKLYADSSPELKRHFKMDAAFGEIVEFLHEGHSHRPFENRYLRTGSRQVIEPNTIVSHLARLNADDRQWLIAHFGDAV